MRGKKNSKPNMHPNSKLLEIFYKLEEQGFIQEKENYFDILKSEILRKEKKEISKLKEELVNHSKRKFKTKDEFISFLEQLLLNLPSHPSIP